MRAISRGNSRTMCSTKMPEFIRWGGPVRYRYSFGWWTGRDGDMMCVKRNKVACMGHDELLSPVCRNRPFAFLAFVAKRFLVGELTQ